LPYVCRNEINDVGRLNESEMVKSHDVALIVRLSPANGLISCQESLLGAGLSVVQPYRGECPFFSSYIMLQVMTHTLVQESLDCVHRNVFRFGPLALSHFHHTWAPRCFS